MSDAEDRLIDSIYEAGLVPELWPTVLEDVARFSNSASGSVQIFPQGESPPRYLTTARTAEPWRQYVESGAWRQTTANPSRMPWTGDVFRQFVPTTRPEHGSNPDDDFSATFGLEKQIGTIIGALPGGYLTFTFERELGSGRHAASELAWLDGMRRHLARAAMASARIGFERAIGAVASLDALGLPAAVLSASGTVVASNSLLDAMSHAVVARAFGGLSLRSGPADAMLRTALSETSSAGHRAVRSIPIPPTDGRAGIALHVLPLRRAARDVLSPGDVLVVFVEMQPDGTGPPVTLLMGLFDLTPAEARLAAGLARGKTLFDIAGEQNIRATTARAYLANVFSKTGTHQQSQLVALLTSGLHPSE